MTYDETGGCEDYFFGFSAENVRFMKPGDSHCTLRCIGKILYTYFYGI